MNFFTLLAYFLTTILAAASCLNFLWNWFVSPVLKIKQVDITEAAGIVLTIFFVRFMMADMSAKETDLSVIELKDIAIKEVISFYLILFFGAIFKGLQWLKH